MTVLSSFKEKEIILFVNRQFFLNFQILLFSGGRQTGTFVGLNIKYLSSSFQQKDFSKNNHLDRVMTE